MKKKRNAAKSDQTQKDPVRVALKKLQDELSGFLGEGGIWGFSINRNYETGDYFLVVSIDEGKAKSLRDYIPNSFEGFPVQIRLMSSPIKFESIDHSISCDTGEDCF